MSYEKIWRLTALLVSAALLCMIALKYGDLSQRKQLYERIHREKEQACDLLNKKELQQVHAMNKAYKASLEKFTNYLLKYQIFLPEELLQATPQSFQDRLQADVTTINEKAKTKHVVVPKDFFLGLSQYKELPPQEQELLSIKKQESILNWIANTTVTQSDLILNKFLFEQRDAHLGKAANISIISLGYLTLSITTNENSFQKILNDISSSPYFLLIENITVENSNQKGPLHVSEKQTLESTDLNKRAILGKEKITVILKLQLFDFTQ